MLPSEGEKLKHANCYFCFLFPQSRIFWLRCNICDGAALAGGDEQDQVLIKIRIGKKLRFFMFLILNYYNTSIIPIYYKK